MLELTAVKWLEAAVAAALVGFSKTGISGLGIIIVPLMADVMPAKQSTGWLLPMLLFADIFAVAWYRRHAQWSILARLLPWVLPGVALGCLALDRIPNERMDAVFGTLILAMIAVKLVKDSRGGWLEQHLPHQWWFSAAVGLLAGFTTMIGNLAGPIMSVYLISMGLPKRQFMGTGAWYYLIVNAVKIPFSAGLGFITWNSLKFNAVLAPLVVLGIYAGLFAFPRIPQKWFDRIIVFLAVIAGARLLLK